MKNIISGILLATATVLTIQAQAETVAEALANPTRLASDLVRDKRSQPEAILEQRDSKAG